MPITTVLFDLDDTLTDAAHFGARVLTHAVAEHGHSLEIEVVRRYPGVRYVPLLQQLLGIPLSQATDIYSTYLRQYSETMNGALEEKAGATALLTGLAERDLRLGLVTNKIEHLAVEIIELFGWGPLFQVVVGQDSCDFRKPHPGIAMHALHVLQARPGVAAFVGDTGGDMECASSAGIQTVIGLVSTTAGSMLTEAGATHICENLSDVLSVIRQ